MRLARHQRRACGGGRGELVDLGWPAGGGVLAGVTSDFGATANAQEANASAGAASRYDLGGKGRWRFWDILRPRKIEISYNV